MAKIDKLLNYLICLLKLYIYVFFCTNIKQINMCCMRLAGSLGLSQIVLRLKVFEWGMR